MVEKAKTLMTAQNLMERALELLDAVEEAGPAVHLQMALDTLTGFRSRARSKARHRRRRSSAPMA